MNKGRYVACRSRRRKQTDYYVFLYVCLYKILNGFKYTRAIKSLGALSNDEQGHDLLRAQLSAAAAHVLHTLY